MTSLQAFATDRRLQGYSSRTVGEDLRVLRNVPYELPGTVRQAKDWLAQRQREVSLATVHREICSLKSFGRWWGAELGMEDPLLGLSYPKVPRSAPGKIADETELRRALNVLGPYSQNSNPNNARDHAILSTFAFTGMRRSELVRLELDDLDLDDMTLLIRLTKNGRPRTVPVHARLAQSMHRYVRLSRSRHPMATSPYLFLGLKGPLRADSVSRVFARINRDAHTTLASHQLRRRLAKTWIEGGGADDALMLIAGWSTLEMPMRYRRDAVEQIARDQYHQIFSDSGVEPVKPGPRRRPRGT